MRASMLSGIKKVILRKTSRKSRGTTDAEAAPPPSGVGPSGSEAQHPTDPVQSSEDPGVNGSALIENVVTSDVPETHAADSGASGDAETRRYETVLASDLYPITNREPEPRESETNAIESIGARARAAEAKTTETETAEPAVMETRTTEPERTGTETTELEPMKPEALESNLMEDEAGERESAKPVQYQTLLESLARPSGLSSREGTRHGTIAGVGGQGGAECADLHVLLEAAGNSLFITVNPPAEVSIREDGLIRAPLDLVTVIDVSASMSTPAPLYTERAKPKEDTGLSVLDVVKHAMKTIIASMENNDRLAIVAFSNVAQVISDFISTDESGKRQLNAAIEAMVCRSTTNLWDGLKTGMNLLNQLQTNCQEASEGKRLSSVFILTDGQPNIEPPRGHIPMLEKHLRTLNPKLRLSISTFGFGYDLDSTLLSDIARVGGGGFGFIPDPGMVGTVFVHAASNLCATYATRGYLNVEIPGQDVDQLERPNGGFPFDEERWGTKINFGDLQYGQTRDLVLRFSGSTRGIPEGTKVTAVVEPWFASQSAAASVTAVDKISISDSAGKVVARRSNQSMTKEHKYNAHRLTLVDSIFTLCTKFAPVSSHQKDYWPRNASNILLEAERAFTFQSESITSDPDLASYEPAQSLARDIAGEITLAVSDADNWERWGRHYLLSLARSHQRQQCGNFKDAGLQVYGRDSALFTKMRDLMDDAFDNIPPPEPSLELNKPIYRPAAITQNTSQRGQSGKAVDMRSYNSSDAPCFIGRSMVSLPDGTKIRADMIVRGTVVKTLAGPRKVRAVLKTKIANGQQVAVCKIGTLGVTPWHPIFYKGEWCFPTTISQPEYDNYDAVYSFLLEPDENVYSHILEIEGIEAVSLGHGLEGLSEGWEDIRVHPFFGSYEKVVAALESLDGYNDMDGVVQCYGVVRDPADGLIKGFLGEQMQTEKARFTGVQELCGQVLVHG